MGYRAIFVSIPFRAVITLLWLTFNAPGSAMRADAQVPLVPQKGHATAVEALAFSPDDTLLATGGEDWTVRLWDLRTGALLRSFPVDGSWHIRFAFSPDGRAIAPFLRSGKASLRDIASGKILGTLDNGTEPTSIAFSPDGNVLALGGTEDNISLWDYHTGQRLRSIRSHVGEVGSLRFSADSALLACTGGTFSIGHQNAEVWGARTGALVSSFETSGTVRSAAFAPDGKSIALGCGSWPENTAVEIWPLSGGTRLKKIDCDRYELSGLAYGPDGATIVAADAQGLVRVWDSTTGALVRKMGTPDFIVPVAVSADARLAAVGPHAGSAYVYDTATGKLKCVIGGSKHTVLSVSVTDTGHTLVAAGARHTLTDKTGEVTFWDARTGIYHGAILWGKGDLTSVSTTPDGRLLAATDGSAVSLWNIHRKTLLATVGDATGEERRLTVAVLSPDGHRLVIGGERKKTRAEIVKSKPDRSGYIAQETGVFELWDVDRRRKIVAMNTGLDDINAAAFSANGAHLYGPCVSGVAEWDMRTGKIRRTLSRIIVTGFGISLSVNDEVVAASAYEGVNIWNTRSGAKVRTVSAPDFHSALAVSPDHQQAAVGGTDGSISLWNVASGKRIAKLGGDGTRTESVVYLPDGKSLVGFDSEQGIRIWDSQTGRLKATSALLGAPDDPAAKTSWATWTPENFYTGSAGVEAYLRWRVNGQIVTGDVYRETHRRPATVERSLSGKIQPGLIEKIEADSAHWRSQTQRVSTASGSVAKIPGTVTKPEDASLDPSVMLRRTLSTGYTYNNPERTAAEVREIEQALAKGADINIQGKWGESALMFLSREGDVEAVKSLLPHGPKLDLVDMYGVSALMQAVQSGHTAVAQALLDAGADIKDRSGKSLLSLKGRPDDLGAALIALLERPDRLQQALIDDRSASFDGESTAIVLLQLGAAPNVRDKDGQTAIQLASGPNLVEALLAHGATANTSDRNGMPLIVEWAMGGRTDLVKIALDHGVDVNTAAPQGWTSLLLAAQGGHDEVVNLLLDRHADPNLARKDGRTPLMMAISEGHFDMAKRILEHGAAVAPSEETGWTALTYAVSREDAEATRLLLDKGANVSVKTKDGETLMQVLGNFDNSKEDAYGIAALLRQHGETK